MMSNTGVNNKNKETNNTVKIKRETSPKNSSKTRNKKTSTTSKNIKKFPKTSKSPKTTKSTADESDSWTEKQVQSLLKAWRETPADATLFWAEVAEYVPGKTSAQCANKYDSFFGEGNQKKKKRPSLVSASPIRLDSNLRTAKNRRKIRHFIKKSQQSHKNDAFTSVQFKEKFGEWSEDESSSSETDDKQLHNLLTKKKESSTEEISEEETPYLTAGNLDNFDKYITRFAHIRARSSKSKKTPPVQIPKKKRTRHNEEVEVLVSQVSKLIATKKYKMTEKEDLEADGEIVDEYDDVEKGSEEE